MRGWASVQNDFCDQIVICITKSNGSKVPKAGGVSIFRNETDESLICLIGHVSFLKSLPTKGYGLGTHDVPVCLVHEVVEPIWATGFHGLERFESSDNFTVSKGGIQRVDAFSSIPILVFVLIVSVSVVTKLASLVQSSEELKGVVQDVFLIFIHLSRVISQK